MTLLTAAQAATLADLAYDTAAATDAEGAAWRAQTSLAALQRRKGALFDAFSAQGGLEGRSGAFHLAETSGFGAVFERKGPTHELVIAFRGTVSARDWISNLNVGMEAGPHGAVVHAGFHRVYQSVQDALHALICKAKPEVLHFVGHSLGGAMATLAMADFGLGNGGRTCHLYTFGTPRIGGFGLNSQLRRVLSPSTVRRVYSVADPVPMLPLLPFQHFGAGATGVDFGFARISAASHDRIQYRNRMPGDGWPPLTPLAQKCDPAFWLARAERAPGLSAAGYHALSMALAGIMGMLNGGGLALSAGVTVLDRLTEALAQAARLSRTLGELTLRFVRAALAQVGRPVMAAGATVADLTTGFLSLVLEMLLAPVRQAATLAVAAIH